MMTKTKKRAKDTSPNHASNGLNSAVATKEAHQDQQMNGAAEGSQDGFRTNPNGAAADEIRLSEVIEGVDLLNLRPAIINDAIYKPVSHDDPTIIELAQDIAEKGLLQPIIITEDNVIISGHRRHAACLLARRKDVPVQRINLHSDDPRFESLLVSYNQQRVKTAAEQIREEVIRTSPEDAYKTLLSHREAERDKTYRRVQDAGLRTLDPACARRRATISDAKRPMLDAAIAVIEQYKDFWPLTLRQIHYRLLTRNVLRNAKKPGSLYVNTEQCYKDLSNLLTRARLDGVVPWESMHDPTRPRREWDQWVNVAEYTREQLDSFLCSYRRDLLQSQPAYIELVVEKITVQDIAERAADPFRIPVGVGRGYTSVTSLEETAERFRASGKDHFILLIAGDFDPEGENICETWAAHLREEHGIHHLDPIKVGVNPNQIEQFNLSSLPVKKTSSRAKGFEAEHGENVYELEAFEPEQLQSIIRNAISSVLDMNKFAEEQKREHEDAQILMAFRKRAQGLLKDCDPANMG